MQLSMFRFAVVSVAVVALGAATSLAQDRSDDPWKIRIDRSGSTPLALNQDEPDEAEESAEPQADTSTMIESDDDMSEPEPILWKGFLYGDQHFRDKPRPSGCENAILRFATPLLI